MLIELLFDYAIFLNVMISLRLYYVFFLGKSNTTTGGAGAGAGPKSTSNIADAALSGMHHSKFNL